MPPRAEGIRDTGKDFEWKETMQIPCHFWRRGKEWELSWIKLAGAGVLFCLFCTRFLEQDTLNGLNRKSRTSGFKVAQLGGSCKHLGEGSYAATSHMGLECCQLSVPGRKGLLGTHIPGAPQSPLVHGLYRSLCASVWAQRIGGLVALAQDTEVTVC